jgi:hypothetical protein
MEPHDQWEREVPIVTYNQTEAFDKITDAIAEAPAGQWFDPASAAEACDVYLLDPNLNEGDGFDGNVPELVAAVAAWIAERLTKLDH